MKKLYLLVLILILTLTGCGANKSYDIKIVIPAGSQEEFIYSEEEISPQKDSIKIYAGEGLGDTEVVLKPIEVKEENAYEPTYLTPGMPVEMEAEKDGWFKVGVSVQNQSDEDMTVYVTVKGIEVRVRAIAEE